MTGLVLKLAPKERILINGAVIENGERRSRMNILTPNVKILRLKDAIHPNDVNTPVKRVCYILQLCLSGEVIQSDAEKQVLKGLEQLSQIFTDSDSRKILQKATENILGSQMYPALKCLRLLLIREERVIAGGTR